MKTLNRLSFLGVALLFCTTGNSQLKVESNGNVGIGMTTSPAEKLHINGSIRGNQSGGALRINGSYGYVDIGCKYSNNYHTHFYTNTTKGFWFEKTIMLGNGEITTWDTRDLKLCTNYEHLRLIIKESNGYVGINDATPSFTLDVDGTIGVYETLCHSDARLKNNIAALDEQKITNLYNLQARTFTWDNSIFENEKRAEPIIDTLVDVKGSNSTGLDTLPKIGFIAQELMEYYPNLVKQDDEGLYSINYIALIPILVEAIKDHQEQITNLENEVGELKSRQSSLKSESITFDSTDPTFDNSEIKSYLSQNHPNPFNQNTEIDFYISDRVQNAYINIYDLAGKQLKSFKLNLKEHGNVTIIGGEFPPGIYIYTLITDGNMIDSKQMILTD